jgi:hypothetical protein
MTLDIRRRIITTLLNGQVVNTPALYSGGPSFESRPRRPAMLIEVVCGFTQSLQANAGIAP